MRVVSNTTYGPFGGGRTTSKALAGGSATPNGQKLVAKTIPKGIGVVGTGRTTPRPATGGGFEVAETTPITVC